MNSSIDAKKRVAIASIKLIENGHCIGLGSGSTVNCLIVELGKRIQENKLNILGVSTSKQTTELATKQGIPLTTLDRHPILDLAIDGADQVDPELNLIKGMGGALTREKIVDRASKKLVIIVDESKITPQLGVGQVVPVEVIPFAIAPVMEKLVKLGGKPKIRLSKDRNRHFVTDNGNKIVDVDFGAINEAKQLEKKITGVVESGLFIEMAKIVFIGSKNAVKTIERRSVK